MKITANIPLSPHVQVSPEALGRLVGQRPVLRDGNPSRRGEPAHEGEVRGLVTGARLTDDRQVEVTLEAPDEAIPLGWDAIAGMPEFGVRDYSLSASLRTHAAEEVEVVDLFPIPTPTARERGQYERFIHLATSDPGAITHRQRDADERESLTHWQARAVMAVNAERDHLRMTLRCSQCGGRVKDYGCGPTHAALWHDPWLHKDAERPPWET